jgi:hypothetical protein
MKRTLLLMCAALVCGSGLAQAGALCPENTMWGCSDAALITRLPGATTDSFNGTELAWDVSQPCAGDCYDLKAGVLIARGSGSPWGDCNSNVLVHDEYQIVGPPGPALTFSALMQAYTTISGGAGVKGGLAQSWINPGDEQFARTTSGTDESSLSLTYAPGQTFPVWATLRAGGTAPVVGDAYVFAFLRFTGLPAGYSVISCQNYDVPVPAHPITWGGVKALYR